MVHSTRCAHRLTPPCSEYQTAGMKDSSDKFLLHRDVVKKVSMNSNDDPVSPEHNWMFKEIGPLSFSVFSPHLHSFVHHVPLSVGEQLVTCNNIKLFNYKINVTVISYSYWENVNDYKGVYIWIFSIKSLCLCFPLKFSSTANHTRHVKLQKSWVGY